MESEELQILIEKIESQNLEEHATFSICMYGGGSDESYIKANKQGLLLFANELLKAAKNSETILSHPEKKIIPIEYEADWIDQDSTTIIQYIEPVLKIQNNKPNNLTSNSLLSKLMPYGCGLIAVILIAATLIGLWTLAKWIF